MTWLTNIPNILFMMALAAALFAAYTTGLASGARAYGAPVVESNRAMSIAGLAFVVSLALAAAGMFAVTQ